jgi:hypothetical protein
MPENNPNFKLLLFDRAHKLASCVIKQEHEIYPAFMWITGPGHAGDRFCRTTAR